MTQSSLSPNSRDIPLQSNNLSGHQTTRTLYAQGHSGRGYPSTGDGEDGTLTDPQAAQIIYPERSQAVVEDGSRGGWTDIVQVGNRGNSKGEICSSLPLSTQPRSQSPSKQRSSHWNYLWNFLNIQDVRLGCPCRNIHRRWSTILCENLCKSTLSSPICPTVP